MTFLKSVIHQQDIILNKKSYITVTTMKILQVDSVMCKLLQKISFPITRQIYSLFLFGFEHQKSDEIFKTEFFLYMPF